MACTGISQLPFDNAVINGTTIPTSEFVSGSGSYTKSGTDKSTTTADGKIHYDREAINNAASFDVYGDMVELNSGQSVSVEVSLLYGLVVVATFCAIVTAVYNESSRNTTISLAGDATF